jgi:acyl-CoA reductase-like NAD-dependent aldehyde dehydrogenase
VKLSIVHSPLVGTQTLGVGEGRAEEVGLEVETLSSDEEEERYSAVEDGDDATGDDATEDDIASTLENAVKVDDGSTNDELVTTETVGPAGPVVHVETIDDAIVDEEETGELGGVEDLLAGDSALQLPKPD